MSMNANEIKSTARQNVIALLMPVLEENHAIKFADSSFAVLQEINGQQIWVEIAVKSKAYKATKTYEAFDPYAAAEAWEAEKGVKAANAAAKKAEHDAKVSAARTKREAKKEAKEE